MRCLARRPGPPWCGNPGPDTRASTWANARPASVRRGHRARGQRGSRGRALCHNWTGASGGRGAASCGGWRLVTSRMLCCHESRVRCLVTRVAGDGARGWRRRPGSSGGSGGCPWSRRSSSGPGGSHTARTAAIPRTRTGSEAGSRGQRPGAGTWPRPRLRTLSRVTDLELVTFSVTVCSEAGASHDHKQRSDLIIRSNKASLKKNNCLNLLSVWTRVTLNISFKIFVMIRS